MPVPSATPHILFSSPFDGFSMPHTTWDVYGLQRHAHRYVLPHLLNPHPPLTCTPTALVEELEGPLFPVIHISKGVGTAPGLGVHLHTLAPSPALQGPAHIAWIWPQGWATTLQPNGLHRHADTGELCLCPGKTTAAQVAQHNPKKPPQGTHCYEQPLHQTQVSEARRSPLRDNLVWLG